MTKSVTKTQHHAGERVKVISRKFSSVPMLYEFYVEPVTADEKLSGSVEVEITQTLMRNKRFALPLLSQNKIKAGLWDTFMDVYVVADQDVIISQPKRLMRGKFLIIALVVGIVALASVFMMMAIQG